MTAKTTPRQTCTTRCNRTGTYLWGGVVVLVLFIILLSSGTRSTVTSDVTSADPVAPTPTEEKTGQ